MLKEKQAFADMSMIGKQTASRWSGDAVDLCFCVERGMVEMIRENPFMRGMLRRTMRRVLRETRSRRAWEWLHSAKVSIFVIPAVYGLMWLIGQIGHALGVM